MDSPRKDQMIIDNKLTTDSPSAPNGAKSVHDARKVAQEFESLFTSIMMRSMRSTIDRGDFIPESMGEKIYTQMLDDEYAKEISKNASLGLADLIFKEIERSENSDDSSLGILRGLDRQSWMLDNRFIPQNQAVSGARSSFDSVSAFSGIINDAGKHFNLDPDLITAVIAVESSGNPTAVSPAGAKGLMQLIDSTASEMGVKRVFNPRENIFGGSRYLKQLLEMHNGNEKLALASYNAGPAAVKKYDGIPPYPETINYVENVLKTRTSIADSNNRGGGNE
jgi:soluble lytic murein transglycosylase-like protein